MPTLPFPEYAPDAPDLSPMTSVMSNVVARTPESYGPINSLVSYSANTLDGQCLGAVSVQDTDLSAHLFAGTTDKLYTMTNASAAFADVSGTAYATAVGDVWNFVKFNRTIIATNFASPIQAYTMGSSSTFANLSSGAPRARYVCTPKTFCMVGNTYDPVGGYAPGRIWWSIAGDATTWPTPGSAAAQQGMSDYNDFPGNQAQITGMVSTLTSADVGIFFRSSVWSGTFVGPPDVFDFTPAQNVRGCPAPNSIVQLGGLAYYLGEDGFYGFDGVQSTPIGANKVDKTFWATVNQAALSAVIGAADVANKVIMWIYPAGVSTVPNAALMYRWDIQRWTPAAITAEWLARFISFGTSVDNLPALGFTDVDTMTISMDSSVWIGGALQLGAIDPTHSLAYFNGPTMQAQIGTAAVQMTPGRRSFVQGARPLTDATAPTIALSSRQNVFDTETFGTDVAINVMGDCPQRNEGRIHRFRQTIPAGSAWTQAMGVDVTAIPGGWR